MGTHISPRKRKQIENGKRRQEAKWKSRNGPVVTRKLTPEELAALPRRTPPATP